MHQVQTQYVGMTTQSLDSRFSSQMREMFSKRPADWVQTCLYRHFQNKGHTPSDIRVQPVEHTEDQRSLKKRESAWIKALKTIEPYGLNIIPKPPYTTTIALFYFVFPIVSPLEYSFLVISLLDSLFVPVGIFRVASLRP